MPVAFVCLTLCICVVHACVAYLSTQMSQKNISWISVIPYTLNVVHYSGPKIKVIFWHISTNNITCHFLTHYKCKSYVICTPIFWDTVLTPSHPPLIQQWMGGCRHGVPKNGSTQHFPKCKRFYTIIKLHVTIYKTFEIIIARVKYFYLCDNIWLMTI